jgi:hypothetical protein
MRNKRPAFSNMTNEEVAELLETYPPDALQFMWQNLYVIVDRRVLAELLGMAAEGFDTVDACESSNHAYRLQREVESGERCELYARDWPLA